MFIILRDILIFKQIFFSPQVKRSVIISNNHGIYELPHGSAKKLRLRILSHIAHSIFPDGSACVPTEEKKGLRILGNYKKIRKIQKISEDYSLVPSLIPKMKNLLILAKNC